MERSRAPCSILVGLPPGVRLAPLPHLLRLGDFSGAALVSAAEAGVDGGLWAQHHHRPPHYDHSTAYAVKVRPPLPARAARKAGQLTASSQISLTHHNLLGLRAALTRLTCVTENLRGKTMVVVY